MKIFLLLSSAIIYTFANCKTLPSIKACIPMSKCYPNYGCFSTGGSFCDLTKRPIQFLPQDEAKLDVKFYLYTRKNVLKAQRMSFDQSANGKTNFNKREETKIIIHGFLDNGQMSWMEDMRKSLLIKGDYNVIQVGWEGGSQLPYTQATANTRMVGAIIARFMQELAKKGADVGRFHLIGHSLGSHVAGYAGERMNNKLGRITGLDPAGPYFENTDPEVRLDPTDAKFVDAIHTDGDSVISSVKLEGGFGLMQAVGHVDFYPNGGKKQPDCSKNPITNIIINGIIEGSKWVVACDHLRVMPLFTDTVVSSCPFKAFECGSYDDFKNRKCLRCLRDGSACASMGFSANTYNPNGRTGVKMYLDTNGKSPFCIHNYVIRMSLANVPAARKENGIVYITLIGSQNSQEFALSKKAIMMEKGWSYDVLASTTSVLGSISRIKFRWEHHFDITNPKDTNRIGRTPKLHVENINVQEGDSQTITNYCGRNDGIAYKTIKTIDSADKC